MADRDNIIRMAREAGSMDFGSKSDTHLVTVDVLSRFAQTVIADFLQRTGQCLTNDASREAVIADAVAEEREACARHIRCGAPPLGRRGNRIEIGEEARSAYAESVLERGRHG